MTTSTIALCLSLSSATCLLSPPTEIIRDRVGLKTSLSSRAVTLLCYSFLAMPCLQKKRLVLMLAVMVALLARAPLFSGGVRLELPAHLFSGLRLQEAFPVHVSELEVGEIVGYRLDCGVIHTGDELAAKCGMALDPRKYYVIEFSGPQENASFPLRSGKGGRTK